MPKKKSSTVAALPPELFEAIPQANGAVHRGGQLTQAQAIARRQAGEDVVVCGGDEKANRRLAGFIEMSANGSAKRCPPHASAGPHALPHYQPDPRPPDGHTFYETKHRKTF